MIPPHRRSGEHGFSLLEVVIAVGILVIIAGSTFESLAQRPAAARAAVLGFADLVAQARALAATSSVSDDGGSGASIGVVRDGDVDVATLYRFRPASGAAHQPQAQTDTPPVRLATAITLEVDGAPVAPPFALFFSVAGHASAQAGFAIGVSPPLAAEPPCPLTTGILLTFHDSRQAQTHALSCELAELDVDATVSAP